MPQMIGLQALLQDKAFQDGVTRYTQGVSKMEKETERGASAMSHIWAAGGTAVLAGVGIVAAGIAGIVAASKIGLDSLQSWNNEINTLSDNLGTTGEESSKWAVAFAKVGLSVDEGGAGLNIFTKGLSEYNLAIQEGEGKTTPFGEALERLGVNAFDASGKLRTFEDITPELMDAFQDMPAGIEKSALAMKLFGRSGTKFIDFLSQGSEGLNEATQFAKTFGLELDTDLSNQVEDFGFQMNLVNLGLKGFWVIIGREVLPVAIRFADVLLHQIMPPLIAFAKEHAPKLAAAGELIGNTFMSIWNAVKLLATGDFTGGIFGLTEDAPFVTALLAVRELLLGVIGAVSNLASGDLSGTWDALSNSLQRFWDLLSLAASELWEQIEPGLIAIAQHFWDWLTLDVIPQIPTQLGMLVNGIVDWLKANGPALFNQLVTWGTAFWGWVTNPDGVLAKIPEHAFQITTSLASWLQTNWTTTVAPELNQWGAQFWDWVEKIAIPALAQNLNPILIAFDTWAQSPETQNRLYFLGVDLATAVLNGIKGLFSGGSGLELTNLSIDALLESFQRAIPQKQSAIMDIGKQIGLGFRDGFIAWFNSDDAVAIRQANFEWLVRAIDGLDFHSIAQRIVQGIIDALSGMSLNLPDIFGQAATTPPPSTTGGSSTSTSPPSQAPGMIQAVPLSLNIQIGENQISEAVATWANNAVGATVGEALAALGSGS